MLLHVIQKQYLVVTCLLEKRFQMLLVDIYNWKQNEIKNCLTEMLVYLTHCTRK